MKNKLIITYLKENQITPYAKNQRIHPAEQITTLAKSIKAFGASSPIGIQEGVIVYGHARFLAMKKLGFKEFPTVDLYHLSKDEVKRFRIADNKIGELSYFDDSLLKEEIDSLLCTPDFDLSSLGFSNDELNSILEGETLEMDEELDEESVFEEEEQKPKNEIKLSVVCGNDTDKQQLKEELLSRGYLCQ